jgi:hypothetical protein
MFGGLDFGVEVDAEGVLAADGEADAGAEAWAGSKLIELAAGLEHCKQ